MLSNDKTEFAVNEKVISGRVGTNMVETSFVAADKVPETPDTPVQPSLWTRIVNFFKRIFGPVIDFFRRVFSKLGLS